MRMLQLQSVFRWSFWLGGLGVELVLMLTCSIRFVPVCSFGYLRTGSSAPLESLFLQFFCGQSVVSWGQLHQRAVGVQAVI